MNKKINYNKLLDIEVTLESNLGTIDLTASQISQLTRGSIIDLGKPAGDSVEFIVNERMLGKGEIMVYEKNLAIRVNEVLDSDTIEHYLGKEDEK